MPPTFAGYCRQRFRWTYGPVHSLTPGQKLHHANHGLDAVAVGVRALAVRLGALTACSMLIHHERVPVPVELWAASSSALIGSLVPGYLVYTRSRERPCDKPSEAPSPSPRCPWSLQPRA